MDDYCQCADPLGWNDEDAFGHHVRSCETCGLEIEGFADDMDAAHADRTYGEARERAA